MLRHACFQRVLDWAAESWLPEAASRRGPGAPPQSAPSSTPQTSKELANMLRDPVSRGRCPFGADVQEHAATAAAALGYRSHSRILAWWLALLVLYVDGHRLGTGSDAELPFVFGLVADAVATRRGAREATPGGAPEHAVSKLNAKFLPKASAEVRVVPTPLQ